jgi:hypothetical protein
MQVDIGGRTGIQGLPTTAKMRGGSPTANNVDVIVGAGPYACHELPEPKCINSFNI